MRESLIKKKIGFLSPYAKTAFDFSKLSEMEMQALKEKIRVETLVVKEKIF